MTPRLAKQALKNESMKECEARGVSTLTLNSPYKRATQNYHYLTATQEGFSLTSSLMARIAYNHFIEVDVVIPNSTQILAKERSTLNVSDVPMTPIKWSHHIYHSTDDTTEFVCEGDVDSTSKKAEWKRVAFAACGHAAYVMRRQIHRCSLK